METKESVPTVGSIYNSFTDKEKSAIHFLVGCSLEKTKNDNEYEDFKINTLHVDKLFDVVDSMNSNSTMGSIFKAFTFDQKMVVGLLIGYAMVENENEKENAKQKDAYVDNLNYERVRVGLSFLFSEGFYD